MMIEKYSPPDEDEKEEEGCSPSFCSWRDRLSCSHIFSIV